MGRYAAQHPVLEQLNQKLEARSDTLRRRIAVYVEKRIQRAYPEAARRQPTAVQKGKADFLSAADLLWLFVIGAFLGGVYEYVCSAVTELLFGTVFWDYSKFKFNLGGRINLLYCFFWGIAAVMWMRYGYPLVLKLMKKVRSHIRPWMTAALAVFMAVNMLTSALALARYDARTSGDAPNGQLEVFLDEHFDNARMEHIYPNAKKVTKAE